MRNTSLKSPRIIGEVSTQDFQNFCEAENPFATNGETFFDPCFFFDDLTADLNNLAPCYRPTQINSPASATPV
jgi:hypothetical protein